MASVQKLFRELFEGLSPRQKEVLSGRFGVEGEKESQTLAAIGDRYGVTRERIRQIEASGLSALAGKMRATPSCNELVTTTQKALRSAGGVLKQEGLLARARSTAEGLNDRYLELMVRATNAFSAYPEDKDFWTFYYLDRPSFKKAAEFINGFSKSLRSNKAEILNGAFDAHFGKFARREKVSPQLAKNYLAISKKFHENPYGDTGLAEWGEIKPKTIRDRIYLVLKKKKDPLHFEAIAKHINTSGLGGRKALAPTVHNELIKDDRFVLVGRGIYGLAEHGYEAGTAREVIRKVLKSHGPMTFDQVVAKIETSRIFKPNTILANLQRKDLFERLDNGSYRVREA
ncbi:MAG: hypothetical protein HY435_02260 [Candidatus Liptonbacteria bacterium]|nr:hypothetical protein [Candidatus Liptonbacteria bacterium]